MLRKFFQKYIVLRRSLVKNYAEIVYYADPVRRRKVFEAIQKVRDAELLMSNSEAYQLYSLVASTNKISGDLAEVGVYKGRSARLMLDASEYKKHIHLFDTFSGLPTPSQEDLQEHSFVGGEYFASRGEVESYLKDIETHTSLYEGIFPTTSDPVKDKTFSFVNIDVDLYQGTYDALAFFYPRMTRGGIIISHDYIMDGGVRDAFVKFFDDKPESIFEVGAGSQGFVVKM